MLQSACDKQVENAIRSFKSERQFDTIYRRIQHSSSLSQRTVAGTSTNLTPMDSAAADKTDPRELDDLLSEITLINANCEVYIRFIRKRLNEDCELAFPLVDNAKTNECVEQLKKIERFLNESGLNGILHSFIQQYILIEDYFMRESIYKAIVLDSPNMVDDVFFILRKCLT